MAYSVHVGKSIDIAFTVTGADGQPDTSIPATVSWEGANVTAGIRPDNPRVAFIDGRVATSPIIVNVNVFIGGTWFHLTWQVEVAAAVVPNLGGISQSGPPSAEYVTPATR